MSATETGPKDVTVLLPVFFRDAAPERVRLLRRALESVQDQAFPGAVDLLLVDDGSPVPVESHRQDLGPAGQAARILRSPTNRGVTHALNCGLAAARHGLIARLDADDIWRPGKMAAQMELFAADPDLSLCATGMVLVTPEGKRLSEHVRPAEWGPILRFAVDVGCPFPHGSVVARRDVYLALGGYPHLASYDHCEDFALWSLWIRFFRPRMVEKVLYEYTVSPQAVSQTHAAQQARASGFLRQELAQLDLAERLPAAMVAFAAALGLSVLEAGLIALRMWRHALPVRMPEAALEPLRILLPDRDVDCLAHHPGALTPADMVQGERRMHGSGVIALARPVQWSPAPVTLRA